VPLGKTLTVIVYSIATQLFLYYTLPGQPETLAAFDAYFTVPLNETAALRPERRDADGNVVPIRAQTLADDDGPRFDVVGAGAGLGILTPLSLSVAGP
jgi:hypothetical protein